jgi:DNA-binding CsgD family transcriptional regulator
MRHNEGYRRPTRAWQPTDRQRQVLDALVEGKSNVDIGQRLGITVDGAKWHVGELLAQTGCEDRQALARWWQERRERRALGWWPLGFAVPKPALAILVLAVVVGAIAILGRDDDGDEPSPVVPEALDSARSATLWPEEAIEVLAKRDPAPETCEPRERLDLRMSRVMSCARRVSSISGASCMQATARCTSRIGPTEPSPGWAVAGTSAPTSRAAAASVPAARTASSRTRARSTR